MKPNPKLFPIPNPVLFSIPNFFNTKSDTFFRNQIFSIPNSKPSKKWKSFENEKFQNRKVTQKTQNLNETESESFFFTKFVRYRIQNHPKNGKVLKPRTSRREVSKPKRHTLAKIGPNFFDFSLSLHCSAKQSLRINSIVHATQATNNKHKPKQTSQQSDKWKYLLYMLETSRIPLPCWTFHL